jgi:hypothetical protein
MIDEKRLKTGKGRDMIAADQRFYIYVRIQDDKGGMEQSSKTGMRI